VKGRIGTQKIGTLGFGYDPIFFPENQNKTFAQMPLSDKNKFSHRSRATEKFLKFLEDRVSL
jgi:XTP/dITP diphosphohydrolase